MDTKDDSSPFRFGRTSIIYAICRYVERNALRADLVSDAECWRWGSLHHSKHGTAKKTSRLADWPLPSLPGRVEHVNGPRTDAVFAALRRSVRRGSPNGQESSCEEIVRRLDLERMLLTQGRPQKNGS